MSKSILTIQDYSSVGRCSLTAALPILNACGHDTVGLPTAVLSTQTGGIENYTFVDLSKNILPSYNHWKSLNISFDCLHIGFLGTDGAVSAASEIVSDLKKKGALIIVDPVVGDNGNLYPMFDKKYCGKVFNICREADVILPNFTEAVMLAGVEIELEPNQENAQMLLNIFKHNGFKRVIISGISKNAEIGAGVLNEGVISFYYNTKYDAVVHGGGDVFAAVFIGKLLNGKKTEDAVRSAVDFCKEAIDISIKNKADLRFGLLIEKALPLLLKC